MNKFGKKITLFLIDGDPNGKISCELSNWSGKSYKIPRKEMKNLDDRKDLNSPGVYILFGKTEEEINQAYIGEAEIVKNRLIQHLTGKDFWNEAIIFISKDNNLNKAHIKYLESRLYDIAKNADRYILENSTKPTQSNLAEPEVAEMEEYIENLLLITSTLGYKIFEEIPKIDSKEKTDLYIINGNGLNATGAIINEGFVLFKGSTISQKIGSLKKATIKYRENLLENGSIINNGENLILTKDLIFGSPSYAASMVLGRSANGLIEWKCNDKPLKECIKD